jgi:hypothetical protein
MQHKLLLGSTALVSAGILLAGTAPAKADIEVVLGGYTEFGVKYANKDTLRNSDNTRNYLFYMDNELFINANGATESGILYGSHADVELGSGDGNESNVSMDEIGLYFSGNFGRVELGKEDGANNVMGIGGADAQAGTGGIDGDTTNLNQFESLNTGDDTKVNYFTPRVAGFQLGGSFQPGDGDGFTDNDGGQENIVSAGINWVGALGPADLTVAATGIMGQHEKGGTNDDLRSWDAGALFGFGGFTVGVGGGSNTDLAEGYFYNGGVKYGFGAANVSVGYNHFDPDGGDSSNLFAVSADVGLLPGVTLKGDVTYNTDDPGANANDPDDTDNTYSAVASIQLNY